MSVLRKCASFISNFKSSRSLLSTLLVRAAKALLCENSIKSGGIGIGIKDCEDRRIFFDLDIETPLGRGYRVDSFHAKPTLTYRNSRVSKN